MSLLGNSIGSHTAGGIYTPLSTERNEIRLLTLNAGVRDTPVQGSLTTAWLDDTDRPQYTALSYTWGSTENPGNIIISGQNLSITANLHIALQHFRKPNEDLCMWIDAICVNQEDLEERGHQVRLMRDVYSRAESTIVWLGPEEDNSAKAMDLINLFDYFHSNYGADMYSDRDMLGPPNSWNIEEEVSALAVFLARPWFHRIWVIQEVAMSRNVVVCCGDRQTLWHCLFTCNKIFNAMLLKYTFQYHDWSGFGRIRYIHQSLYAIQYPLTTQRDINMDMLGLLVKHRVADATDPRDKCIALLGLARGSYSKDVENLYTKSVCEVYTSTMARIASQSQKWPLRFLLCPGQWRGRDDLPSWAPDWSYKKFAGSFVIWLQFGDIDDDADRSFTIYNPTRGLDLDTTNSFFFENNNSTLRVSGVALDMIVTYTATKHNGAGGMFPRRQPRADESFLQHDHNFTEYPTGEAIDDVLWRTLIFDRDWSGHLAPADRWKSLVYCILKTTFQQEAIMMDQNPRDDYLSLTLWDIIQSLQVGGTTIGDVVQEQILKLEEGFEPPDEEFFSVSSTFGAATGGKRLAVSEKGYLGLIPTWTEKDDIIAIIFGCPLPVILRKHDGWYQFIGACYFHGYMEGEAVPGIQSGEYKIQTFEMR